MKNLFLSLLLVATAATARADVLLGDAAWATPTTPATPDAVYRVSGATGEVLSSFEFPLLRSSQKQDAVLGPDGWVYAAGNNGGVDRFRPDGTAVDVPWLLLPVPGDDDRAQDVAFAPDRRLIVASRGFAWAGFNAVVAVDTATRAVEILNRPGDDFEIMGMDVPKAGPLEGGVVLTGRERGAYRVRRLARQPDGSLAVDGADGPLDLVNDRDCTWDGAPAVRPRVHLAMRPDGRTFLMPDGCTNSVKEFDLEGHLVRVVATLTPDPVNAILDGPEYIENVHVTDDGTIWAVMQRRVWHLDASGGVLQRVDHLFHWARAACDDHFVPFASDAAGCHGAGLGWWKRQCLALQGAATRRGGGRPASADLPAPRPLPGSDAVRVLSLLAQVDAQFAPLGVTTCEALWTDTPREPRSRALMHLAVLELNVADQRLGRRCRVPGTDLDVGGVLERVTELLGAHDAEADAEAARLAQRAIAAHAPDREEGP